MGKRGGTSWLTAVKRAFRSPTKESEKKSSRQRREEHDQEDDDEKVFFFQLIISLLLCFFLNLDLFLFKCVVLDLLVLCRRERRGDGYLGKPPIKKR